MCYCACGESFLSEWIRVDWKVENNYWLDWCVWSYRFFQEYFEIDRVWLTSFLTFSPPLFQTRQVMCMGSAASLPLLVVIIVGFFLLGEQLSLGNYDDESDSSSSGNVDESGVRNTSKLMVSVCMIGTATFGIFLLCCFSIWAARVQPHQLEMGSGGLFIQNGQDVESGRGRRNNSSHQGVPVPLYFF